MDIKAMTFDFERPFTFEWCIQPGELDAYQHVNNVQYVIKLEQLAWAHSGYLGLSMDEYEKHDRGMAIIRHEIDYLGAAYLGDVITCATWISHCDKKLKTTRAFQFIRQSDQKTLLRAKTDFVCIELSTGNVKRMPKSYAEVYQGAALNNPSA